MKQRDSRKRRTLKLFSPSSLLFYTVWEEVSQQRLMTFSFFFPLFFIFFLNYYYLTNRDSRRKNQKGQNQTFFLQRLCPANQCLNVLMLSRSLPVETWNFLEREGALDDELIKRESKEALFLFLRFLYRSLSFAGVGIEVKKIRVLVSCGGRGEGGGSRIYGYAFCRG